ncbi:MAG TPA: hypothetical protein PK141_00255 [Polyangiaceae bacterium]|nr:hypothetical protein [Polyangiaceae bacterium]
MDGTTYEIDIPVTGAQAVAAASSSLDELAAAIDRARGASSAAATAMAAGVASYASSEMAANKAAMAAERMGVSVAAQQGKLAAALETGDTSAISAAEAKLASLVERQSEAEAKSSAAAAALASQAASLDGLRAAAAAAAQEEATLASRLEAATQAEEANAAAARETAAANDEAGAAASGGGVKLGELSESLGKLGGPAGVAGQKIAGFGNAFKKLAAMGPAGVLVAVAVAAVAVVAGLAMATIGLLKFGLANADAARTSALLSQGIAGSVEGGIALDKTISGLGSKVPIAADELRNMAADLAKSGLKGDALSAALETAAVKAAKLKFGPDFAKQMLSADYQSQKLKADVGKIFGGLKIEGFLTALQKGAALFDENSAAAKAIKVVFESMFQPLVDGMAGAVPKLIAGFLQFEIWALRSLIAIQKYQPVFTVVGAVVGAVLKSIGQSFGFIYDGVVGTIDGIQALGALGSAALSGLSAAALSVRQFLLGLSLADIGMAMVKGLADGITGGGASVLAAVTGVASGAVDAAKKALGIASPSKVFAEIGGHTADGMSEGVDDGADAVHASREAMVEPPATPAAPPAPAPSGATGGGGATITIGQVVFQVSGDEAGGKKAFAEFMSLLEVAAGQGGGMVPSG